MNFAIGLRQGTPDPSIPRTIVNGLEPKWTVVDDHGRSWLNWNGSRHGLKRTVICMKVYGPDLKSGRWKALKWTVKKYQSGL